MREECGRQAPEWKNVLGDRRERRAVNFRTFAEIFYKFFCCKFFSFANDDMQL